MSRYLIRRIEDRAEGTDEQHVANPLRHQFGPSINERSHQDLADLGVSLNEGVHLVAGQLEDFARLAGAESRHRRATEDHTGFPGEMPRAGKGDQAVAQARGADNLDLASLHDEERHVGLAAFDQHFAARDWTNYPVRGNPRDLSGAQNRNISAASGALVSGEVTTDAGYFEPGRFRNFSYSALAATYRGTSASASRQRSRNA